MTRKAPFVFLDAPELTILKGSEGARARPWFVGFKHAGLSKEFKTCDELDLTQPNTKRYTVRAREQVSNLLLNF